MILKLKIAADFFHLRVGKRVVRKGTRKEVRRDDFWFKEGLVWLGRWRSSRSGSTLISVHSRLFWRSRLCTIAHVSQRK